MHYAFAVSNPAYQCKEYLENYLIKGNVNPHKVFEIIYELTLKGFYGILFFLCVGLFSNSRI